jgi:DNA-binding GntR family transcriptional regulator
MDDDGPQYVYVRAANAIERDIRDGKWAFGARLPGREKLAVRYDVAQMTIRKALRVLEERGIVRVLPSSGAWVTWGGHEQGTREP